MSLSGDCDHNLTKRPAIKFKSKIEFNDQGLISESVDDSSHHSLNDVIQVIDGDINQVLHMIGFRRHDIKSLLDENVLKATDEVNESLQKMSRSHRSPDSYILVHNNRLYGVVVDDTNICRVVGRITSVIPNKDLNDGINLVIVDQKGVQTYCRSTDCNLKESVNSGSILCMASHTGFVFFETNDRTTEEISDLILVLYRGYILFEGLKIDWIRLQTGLRINQFKVKRNTINTKECIICLRGGYVRVNNGLVLYGNESGVLQFDAFLSFANNLQTIGFESGEHITTEDINEFSDEKSNSFDSDLISNSVESKEVSNESIDSVYDNISPDSFS